jgi:hypothetical protein
VERITRVTEEDRMRKLTLDVNELVVETFQPLGRMTRLGTVHAAGGAAVPHDSGDSECPNCWSADPCTDIPIETCTCGCEVVPIDPGGGPVPVHTGCAATSECTCTPIETCSCVPRF